MNWGLTTPSLRVTNGGETGFRPQIVDAMLTVPLTMMRERRTETALLQ